jgi:L-rhamnose mutarotase
MKRKAFKMQLKRGFEAEYKRRHDEIWPELKKLLAEAGVRDYTIYLDPETLSLFAFQRLTEDTTADSLSSLAIMKKWWVYMADIMETNPDSSPVCRDLKEVFHID